jgi:hypothetical protein
VELQTFDHDKAFDAAQKELSADTGGIEIHGKKYKTVARRVESFRRNFKTNARMRIAEHKEDEKGRISMLAVIELRMGNDWIIVAEGRAEEVRGSSSITRTSATEVCETSAYGRALANFGLHGGEFASANEVENAQAKQLKNGAGIGVHSPLGDVTPTDSAVVYSDSIRENIGNPERIAEIHADLHEEGEELYRAVWSLLDSKTRSAFKKIIDQKKAAA